MFIQLSFKDNYSNAYGETYINKMNYLVKVITEYKTGEDSFNVLNFETGLGKSVTVDRLLDEINCFHWNNKQKFLIVKRFNDESEKSVEFIENESAFVVGSALAITHKNWKEWLCKPKELMRKKFIYISHQRYILLCENESLRELFTADRDTLIIDEKINFPVYTYNDKRYLQIFEILPDGLRESLVNICKPLNEFIETQKVLKHTNKVLPIKFKIKSNEIEKFIDDVDIAISNQTIEDKDKRISVSNFLQELQLFYSSQCIYNSGNISTHNPLHKHWGLKNNIILDASGGIDGTYLCNPNKFNIINQSRIIDHKDCSFNIVKFNSSKSKVNTYSEKYFKEMASKIIENKKENDKVLIVGHKDFAIKIHKELVIHNDDIWIDKRDKDNDSDYNNQSIAISWYGNLIGKNWAGDFTQVWLISKPNIPLEHYLIHFLHYSDDKIGNKSTQVHKGRYKNTYFNTIQTGYVAAEMYQSLKRIQRNPEPKGEFFIACDDDEIVSKVLSQIKNANNSKVIELDFVKEEKKEKELQKQINKKPDQVDKFIEYILSEKRGTYKKSDIASQLQISKLNRVILDTRVKTLLNKRLRIHTRTIEII